MRSNGVKKKSSREDVIELIGIKSIAKPQL